jgi:hypothetical protein
MAHLLKCPACGHQHRVSEDQRRKKIICAECEEVFPFSSTQAAAKPSPPTGSDEAFWSKSLKKVLGDPSAALDGALPGAISGVVVGVLGAISVGIFTGEPVGELIGAILVGFVVGFGVGTLLGAALGVCARRFRPAMRIELGLPVLCGGAVIGAIVAAIVEGLRWLPLGAGIGAAGAVLWPLLCSRVETAANEPEDRMTENAFTNDLTNDDEKGKNHRPRHAHVSAGEETDWHA